MIHPLRIYTDTSVIGGCFDEEFAEHSNRLFDLARRGRFHILISPTVTDELIHAPPHVRQKLLDMPDAAVTTLPITPSILALRDAYLDRQIVSSRWRDDATHVAAAAIARADAIVSWNFKHIVRLDLIGRYNDVNRKLGYPQLVIITPMEVTRDLDTQD